jgi:uncharacterized membrane-anchored protein YitT (DUF2179 family)
VRHTLLEDAQGILFGVSMAALGLMFLKAAGLTTGQTAGVALLTSYATGWDLGLVFLGVNIPFYLLALLRMGRAFALKTLIAVALLSVMIDVAPAFVTVSPTHPFAAAFIGGLASGAGLLALFRHGASLGGVGVLAVWLQERAGFRAGWTQMLVDAGVFAAALWVLDWRLALISAAGAAVLNLLIAINHRRDHYVAL